MKIRISDHFTYKKLLLFTLPSMAMMIFTSIYGVVDGFFVSNCVGKTAFASINLILPFIIILGTVGFMIGTGGSALVAFNFGVGNDKKANNIFSLLITLTIFIGITFSVFGIIFMEKMAIFLKATDEMLPYCVTYGRIILVALTFFMIQNVFQSFFVTAEKPTLGLIVMVMAGCLNMLLDWLFMAVLEWGISGAACATAIAQFAGGIIPFIYFLMPNKSKLRLKRPTMDLRAISKTFTNGSSEFMTNISMSITSMLYNFELMRLVGENGVSTYGVLMYVNFIFISAFIGYSIGSAPIVGYNYGAGNHKELKGIFKKSIIILVSMSITLFIMAELLANVLGKTFVGYDEALLNMTVHAFRICSLMFLICGFNIWGSGFFTALNNGFISAFLSFTRTLFFQVVCIFILPRIFGLDGIWWSVVVAEVLALVVTILFVIKNKRRYHYM